MTTTATPGPYRLRSITARDRVALTRFYADLSPDSRVARFNGATPTVPAAAARFFCGPDHEHREGIVAESFDADDDPVIIGHLCIEPIDSGRAELAIAVADAWQGHGVGRAMLARAIAWTQRHAIDRLVASVQCGNTRVFALLRSVGYPVTYGPLVGGTVDAVLDVRASGTVAA